MKSDTRIFVNQHLEPRHEVLLNKVVKRNIIKLSGKVVTKNLFYVMDPRYRQLVAGGRNSYTDIVYGGGRHFGIIEECDR